MVRRTLAALVLLLPFTLAVYGQSDRSAAPDTQTKAAQQTKSLNLAAYAELLRSDVRAEKVAIITEVMGFSEAEDAAFWPIYREYELEMAKLGDERLALIKDYAANYETLTDAVAERLAAGALDLQAKRQALERKCYEGVKAALSPRTAMRFLQVEHQLQLIIDLQIAAALPIAPTVEPPRATKGTAGRK